MKIEKIYENEAICDYLGNKRKVRIDIINNVNEGDYVLIHAGFAIARLEEREGKERLEALKEVEEKLKEIN